MRQTGLCTSLLLHTAVAAVTDTNTPWRNHRPGLPLEGSLESHLRNHWEVLGHSFHICRNKGCTCCFCACKDRICLLETQAMLLLALQRCSLEGRTWDRRTGLIPYAGKGAGKLFFSRASPRRSSVCYLIAATANCSFAPQALLENHHLKRYPLAH